MNNIIANIRTQLQKLKCRIANLSNRVTYIEDNCCNGGGSIEQDNIFRVVEVSLTELGLTTDATESEVQVALSNYIESLNINVEDDEIYVWQVTGYTSEGSGGIQTITAGANIIIDDTDPQNPIISSTGGDGAELFVELNDTPSSYTDQAGRGVRVKGDETGLEYYDTNIVDGITFNNNDSPTANEITRDGVTIKFTNSDLETNEVLLRNVADLAFYSMSDGLNLESTVNSLSLGLTGVLNKSSITPTVQGLYLLSEIGEYTNLTPNLTAVQNHINYAYFDGSVWSLISVEVLTSIPPEEYYFDENMNNSLLEIIADESGYINSTTGAFVSNTQWRVKTYKIIGGRTHFVTGGTVANSTCLIAYYDETMNFISSDRIGTGSTVSYLDEELVSPPNAFYAKVSSRNTTNESNMYQKGSYIFNKKEDSEIIFLETKTLYDSNSETEYISEYPIEIYEGQFVRFDNGELNNGIQYTAKKYIIDHSKEYYANGKVLADVLGCLVHYFDILGRRISAEFQGNSSAVQIFRKQALTIPANAHYMIINGSSLAYPEQFADLLVEHKGYKFPYKTDVLPKKWKGKKAVGIGDSITAFGDSFIKRAMDEIGVTNYTNYGINSSVIAQKESAPTERDPISIRYSDMDDTDVDLVIVAGGTNDCEHSFTPFGAFEDRTPDTFYGALHVLAKGLKEKYLGSTIVFVTPLKRNENLTTPETANSIGKKPVDYVNAIKEVCQYWGIHVYDQFSTCELNPFIELYKTNYMPDGTHPNPNGRELQSKGLIGFLNSIR